MAEISVQQLHKYFGEHHVLKGLSFDLQPLHSSKLLKALDMALNLQPRSTILICSHILHYALG